MTRTLGLERRECPECGKVSTSAVVTKAGVQTAGWTCQHCQQTVDVHRTEEP